MNKFKSRFLFTNIIKFNLPLIVQIALRKFIEFILFFKNFIDLLLVKVHKRSLNILFNFNILNEFNCISHFLNKILSFKKSRFFWCKIFQIHLVSLSLIIDNWTEKIKSYMFFYEYLGRIKYKNTIKDLQSFIIHNEDLISQTEKMSLTKTITFKIVLILRQWIFKKKFTTFPNWFFIKKYQHQKELLTSESLKIKIKKLPSFISILKAKKILIVGLWKNRFFFSLQRKQYLFTDNSVITSLEDFVEYLGIKICDEIFNEIITTFFLFSNKKKINLTLKKNSFGQFSSKTSKIIVKTKFIKLLKLTRFAFKKIKNNFTTKIHICFLDIYKKISLILIHLNKLEYSFNKIIFCTKKANTYFQKEYLKNFFLLRMKSLSFIRIIKQTFLNQIFKTELKFFYKSIQTQKASLVFFKECHHFIGKLYKIFFLNQRTKLVYETFIKIFSSIYSFKQLLNLKKTKNNNNIGKTIFILSIDIATIEVNYVFNYKIKHYKKNFEKNLSIFVSIIYSFQKFKTIISGLNLNFFYFKKIFN